MNVPSSVSKSSIPSSSSVPATARDIFSFVPSSLSQKLDKRLMQDSSFSTKFCTSILSLSSSMSPFPTASSLSRIHL